MKFHDSFDRTNIICNSTTRLPYPFCTCVGKLRMLKNISNFTQANSQVCVFVNVL